MQAALPSPRRGGGTEGSPTLGCALLACGHRSYREIRLCTGDKSLHSDGGEQQPSL